MSSSFIVVGLHLVVRRLSSARGSASMVIACAGQTASQSCTAPRESAKNTHKRQICDDRKGGHGSFANLACDAALLACWVTTKRVLTAEAWAQRVLLVGVVKCELQTVAPSGLAHRRLTGVTLGSSSVSNVLVKPRHISVMNITRLVRSKTATQNPSAINAHKRGYLCLRPFH